MRRHNVENEVAKRDYMAWQKNARGRETSTLDQIAAAIDAYQAQTRYASFKTFRFEKAVAFKDHLAEQVNPRTGKPLSKATMHSRLGALKAFFEWLSREPGYRKTVKYHDAAYFNLTANEARIATAAREQPTPSLDQITHVLQAMPAGTIIERRDRALVAFIILTGARDGAVATLRLKHLDMAKGRVFQDARTVRTKGAKTFTSSFFPVGDLPRQIVTDWTGELQTTQLFGPDDPIFPAAVRGLDAGGRFATTGLSRDAWTTAEPIRRVFKRAFEDAGLPYFPPHRFRTTLGKRMYDLNLDLRQAKAWSQNLGHKSASTTLTSYGTLTSDEQADTMAGIASNPNDASEDLEKVLLRAAAALRRTPQPPTSPGLKT